ncbi:hypothetical protein JTB14_029780 [Gonioctena quinquepunctata]|nr:hypothetical protein JTB14_029780 [Gonioctena quinquepunctata]
MSMVSKAARGTSFASRIEQAQRTTPSPLLAQKDPGSPTSGHGLAQLATPPPRAQIARQGKLLGVPKTQAPGSPDWPMGNRYHPPQSITWRSELKTALRSFGDLGTVIPKVLGKGHIEEKAVWLDLGKGPKLGEPTLAKGGPYRLKGGGKSPWGFPKRGI